MTAVEVFTDPSCPWAWVTSRWLLEVARQRELAISWRSYCLEIRDDYGVAATVPGDYRQQAIDAHAISHRMLRIFEAAREVGGEDVVDRLYGAWGERFFLSKHSSGETILAECVAAAGLDAGLVSAADDETWDGPIRDAMEVAYAFGGPKTQTPTIVVRTDPPHGFKGPVMTPAPTGTDAVRLWDAIQVLSEQPGFFEITRPRTTAPRLRLPD